MKTGTEHNLRRRIIAETSPLLGQPLYHTLKRALAARGRFATLSDAFFGQNNTLAYVAGTTARRDDTREGIEGITETKT